MSATTSLYRLDAHKSRQQQLTTIKSRSFALTNLTEDEARAIGEFLVDRDFKTVPGTEVLAHAAGSLQVTISPLTDTESI